MLTYITNVVCATTNLGGILLFSDVCHQALTLKPLVAQLYVIVCPIICFEGTELL